MPGPPWHPAPPQRISTPAAILTGEGAGIIREVRPGADVLADMVGEAKRILDGGSTA